MTKGKAIVEQVDTEGNVVFDYDNILSTKELYERISNYFPNISRDEEGMVVGYFDENKYSIRAKNITYLGNPHPFYKKRIQISNDLLDFYNESNKKGYKPILLGVYTYKDNLIFCDFKIEDYVSKKAHNSSAHVYVEDIVSATTESFFQKTDANKNRITVFDKESTELFLEDLFDEEQELILELKKNTKDNCALSKETIERIEDYFKHLNKMWHGISCYQEMIHYNYKNKFQPEWAGFYLEYTFEEYLRVNNLEGLIRYAQDKTSDGIDLDLYFPDIEQYGDLKAHSDYSNAIQGNDWKTIENLVMSGKHIYYIVCEHSTEKDSDYDFEVTKYWNKVQNKENILSYSKRMKNSVVLEKAYILDINKDNFNYLSKFKQGINSDGKPREPKIMIDIKNLEHFVIKEIPL